MICKIIILSALAALTSAHIVQLGPCPKVSVLQDFDVAAYLGQWYQIQRFPTAFEVGNCSSALYGPVEDGLVKVHNAEIVNGTESTIDGTAELANPNSTEAKLIVKFFNPDTVADYWVLGTDYTNYSVVWSCRTESIANFQYAWILAREKPLSEENMNAALQILKDNKLRIDFLESHDLPECAKLP